MIRATEELTGAALDLAVAHSRGLKARLEDGVVRHGSNKGAALALGLSVKTVETHRDNLCKATGARSSLAALCAWAQERAMQGDQS